MAAMRPAVHCHQFQEVCLRRTADGFNSYGFVPLRFQKTRREIPRPITPEKNLLIGKDLRVPNDRISSECLIIQLQQVNHTSHQRASNMFNNQPENEPLSC